MTENQKKRYTITAALIYANGPIHIGHLAGCYLPADIFARYLRKNNHDVAFISGTDEHGVPITIKAKNENTTPQAVVDKYYTIIKDSFEQFGISFDIYSRTSKQAHHEVSQDFFTTLYDKKVFTEEVTEQYFDAKANQFLADRYIVGTCPHCSNENAYGDQCEKCGSTLSPTDLINPKSTLSGEVPVFKSTKNWYLPLDKMQPEIESFVNSHSEWKSNVLGQCQSWLKQGLQPRAMTRDLEWGVKVPLKDAEGKVLYVWFDAPIGYITFTQEWAKANGKNWEDYWKNEDTNLIHFIGKDNIVFHCIIFPAMLMAHGGYILPNNVPANEFMNLEGNKISTSRNWAVWLHEYLVEFPNRQDELRYALCANAPENKDNDFTWKDFQARNNNELVAVLGNFINRVLSLTQNYYGGVVPSKPSNYTLTESTEALTELAKYPEIIGNNIANYKFRDALTELMNVARLGNKYLQDTAPWKKFKEDKVANSEAIAEIMFVALQISGNIAFLMQPFMPFVSAKLLGMLNIEDNKSWSDLGYDNIIVPQQQIKYDGTLLFNKIEDETIAAQIQKLEDAKLANELASKVVAPSKSEITFDDFSKIDIRIATIIAAESVPKTKKLLKLTVDTGLDQRTIVSGIAEHFKPEEIIGKQVSVLINLAPRDLKGIASQGMILMAEDKDGKLKFLQPNEIVANGSVVA